MFNLLKTLLFTAGPKYSWKRALFLIILSMASVLTIIFSRSYIRIGVQTLQRGKKTDLITAIVHTGIQPDQYTHLKFYPLHSGYFAEVLDLSIDEPKNFLEFNLRDAQEKLLFTHLIERVQLKKIQPSFLFIDYQLREPWAILEDYTNTAIDPQGYCFPFSPYYSPRHLPKIYLGEHAPSQPWGETVQKEFLKFVHQIRDSLNEEEIERIDLSHVESASSGQREIVITLKKGTILRLAPKNCIQQLTHYSILKARETDSRWIIDLRIPEVAYLKRIYIPKKHEE